MEWDSVNFKRLRKEAGMTVNEVAAATEVSYRTVYRWENEGKTPPLSVIEFLNKKIGEKPKQKGDFLFADLLCGIGGMRQGVEAAGGKCVYAVERDQLAHTTYLANYNCDHLLENEISKVATAKIPWVDLIVAGFPCQPFSLAGIGAKNALKQPHGFLCEYQGNVFSHIARIFDDVKPKAFLLENVKHILSHDKGKTINIITHTLSVMLNYDIRVKVIDARPFVPQHRERVFIVGFRKETDFSLDDLVLNGTNPILNSILHPEDGSEEPNIEKYTMKEKGWKWLQGHAEKHRKKGQSFGYRFVDRNGISPTLPANYWRSGREILIEQKDKPPRLLTPRECARLMGFGDDFKIPVSKTQAYKQFGNAVVPQLIEAIVNHMKPHFVEKRDFFGDKNSAI